MSFANGDARQIEILLVEDKPVDFPKFMRMVEQIDESRVTVMTRRGQ